MFRTFWEGVWMNTVVLFRFWYLVWFVVRSKKRRQVRKGSRGNACIRNTVDRLPNRCRRHGIRTEGWLRVGSH